MTITLVLGAGASTHLGYPTGGELRAEIIGLIKPEQTELTISAGLLQHGGELDRFVTAFARSQMYSIDAFLARRPEYVDIGKRAIATCLLCRESEPRLFVSEPQGHWYRYLFNTLCRDSIDNVSLSKVSVITFNYDRSLEAYLLMSIAATFNVPIEVAGETLKELRINHVYGCLGSPIEHQPVYLEYGADISARRVKLAADGIKVIPEGRNDDAALTQARTELDSASSIVFLGFGFDEDNLRRLNTRETCRRMKQIADGIWARPLFATCLGMTRAEAMRAHDSLGQSLPQYEVEKSLPSGFYDADCLQLLRETLVLEK